MNDPGLSPPRSKRQKLAKDTAGPTTHGITIFSWNINGIATFVQPAITSYFKPKSDNSNTQSPKASFRDFLRRHDWPAVLCLQEVKINPDDTATIAAVRKAVKRQPGESVDAPNYDAHFCLPSDKYNARGFGRKVYGVCSIIRKDFNDEYVDDVRTVTWDAEGRFSIIETKAKSKIPKLAIINVYAVNGTEHPYRDSTTGEETGTRHDRKLQVHALLQAECRGLEARGFGVVVVGDINIARGPIDGHPNLRTFPKQHCLNRADFEARFLSDVGKGAPSAKDNTSPHVETCFGMIDSFRHLHPQQRSYTYYPRTKTFGESCDRVDMILISRSLKDSLKEAGMHETPSERGTSDHVPLFARLGFEDREDEPG